MVDSTTIEALQLSQRLGEILVAPARQADEVRTGTRVLERPGDRVRAFQGGDDALQARGLSKGGQGLPVVHGQVPSPGLIAPPGTDGAAARVIEAGRDRVRLEDLTVLVLHDGREGAVQDAARPA